MDSLSQPQPRPVLRGPERDAAVLAAAVWCRQNREADLNTIADRFNISMTASAEAVLIAREGVNATAK